MKTGKWDTEETRLIFLFIDSINREELSVYKAAIQAAQLLDRKYTSCYDKIQKERKRLKTKR